MDKIKEFFTKLLHSKQFVPTLYLSTIILDLSCVALCAANKSSYSIIVFYIVVALLLGYLFVRDIVEG